MTAKIYFRTAIKEIARKPARNLLATGALLLCSLVLVVLVAFTYAVHQILLAQLGPSQNLGLLTVTAAKNSSLLGIYGNVQLANQENTLLTNGVVQSIDKIPHVSFVSPVSSIYEFKNFQIADTNKTFVAQAEGLAEPNNESLPLATGHLFNPKATTHLVILGQAYAKELGYGHNLSALIGKKAIITTQNGYRGAGADLPGPITTQAQNDQYDNTATMLTATIIGITSSGPGQNELFIPEAWAHQVRTLSYWEYDPTKAATVTDPSSAPYAAVGNLKSTDQIDEDGYSSIIVGATATQYVPDISAAINRMGLGVVSSAQLVAQLNTYSKVLWLIVGSLGLITFVASSLGIVNTFSMLVNEQRYVIAIWRACGTTKKQILYQYLLHAALIGLIGGIIGTVSGYGLTVLAVHRALHLLQGSSLVIAQLSISPYILISGGIGCTVLFSIVAGIFPAISAANEDLSQALSTGQ